MNEGPSPTGVNAMRIGPCAGKLLCLLVFGVIPVVHASASPDFSLERSLFLIAERALTQQDERGLIATREVLEEYPLLQYLEYRLLARNLSAAEPESIAEFLENHADGPLAGMLRNSYLDHLAKERDWRAFLRFAGDGTNLSTERTCFRMQALLNTGSLPAALDGIENIWLHGRSQPKACDAALNAWRAEGGLTSELAWQRLELAIAANQPALARYLRRYLAPTDSPWADRWLELEANPERLLQAGFRAGDHPVASRIVESAFQRWVPRDLEQALATWRTHGQRLDLEPEHQNRIQHAIALRLAVRKHPETLTFMASLPDATFDDQLRQWQVRAALHNQDWNTVLRAVDGMDPETQAEAPWQYWRGRALERTGNQDAALAAYRLAAQERNFHGFLAADRLGQPYRIGHEPLQVSAEVLDRIAHHPSILRMRELVLLERFPEARREWSHAIDRMSPAEQEAAARLFSEWGWHDRAIFTVARARSWGDIDLRFPLAFDDLILAGARDQEIDPAWAMAIARQESAFLHDVRSGAGALGIMQIMPATGRSVASAAGVRIRTNADILKPENNTRLGTYYLRRNLDGFGGHSMLSTAAYNAGAHRVRQWLPENGAMEPDIWAELIPFHETRDYVQRVFAYRIIYAVRLGLTPPSLDTLLFPVTPLDRLAQSRESHLASLGIVGPALVSTRDFCDAPGYTSARCL